MATIVNASRNVKMSNQVISAVEMLRSGIGVLKSLDGLRVESIAAGAATMGANFGVTVDAEAQALSDRWAAFLAAYNDTGNAEMAKLRVVIDDFVA